MYTCCIIPPLFLDTFACEKLIMAYCEHLYNVMGNWKCLLCMIQHPMESDKCTFKIWNTGQRLCFGLDVLEHFILFSKCKYQYQTTPCSHTHVQELLYPCLHLIHTHYTIKLLGTSALPVGIFGCRPRVKLQEDDAHEEVTDGKSFQSQWGQRSELESAMC